MVVDATVAEVVAVVAMTRMVVVDMNRIMLMVIHHRLHHTMEVQ